MEDQGALSCLILALLGFRSPSSLHPPFSASSVDAGAPRTPASTFPSLRGSASAEENGIFLRPNGSKDVFFFSIWESSAALGPMMTIRETIFE